jgi:hypothetical protein
MKAFMPALPALAAGTALCVATTAQAHHSYAMFDGTKTLTVKGTVAKVEWTNPHVFIWIYVPNAAAKDGYDLYAFENGSTNVLARRGWSQDTLTPGEDVSIEYWPLLDGRTGGHFRAATHSDGRVSQGAGGPRGVDSNAPTGVTAAPATVSPTTP